MAFESDVVVRELDALRWRLVEPLVYTGAKESFTVPAGFETDFASVPTAFGWLLPRAGRYTKAAILHDYLCRESAAGRFDRDDADGIFRRTMRELDVPFLRRWIMWAAVASATTWLHRRHLLRRLRSARTLQILLVAVPSVVFFLVPFAVVTVWGVLFWLAEGIAYVILRAFGHRQANAPRATLPR